MTTKERGNEMETITFEVTLTVKGDVKEMGKLFAQYLTQPDNPFIEDYGPDAWGGWEGPFVMGVSVRNREAHVIDTWFADQYDH